MKTFVLHKFFWSTSLVVHIPTIYEQNYSRLTSDEIDAGETGDWYCSSSMTLTGQWTVLLMLEYCHLIVSLLYKVSHAEFSSNTIQRQEPNLKLTNCCKYQSSDPLQVSQLCCHCDRNISGQQRKHSLVQVNLWQSLFRVWWDDDVFVVW